MKRKQITACIGLVIALGLVSELIPGLAETASCADCPTDSLPAIGKAFETFNENCKKQLGDRTAPKEACFDTNTYYKIVPIMKALARDNRFGPAKHSLIIGDTQTGSVSPGVDRVFQTVAPLNNDSLTVEIKVSDASSGPLVRICAIDEAGTATRVGTIRFERNEPARSATLTGVQGKMLRIDISGARKRLDFILKTT